MKYLVELYPSPEIKNAFEMDPGKQEKVGKAIEKMEPLSAWFTFRYGFFVIEAASPDELTRKIAPLFHLFETDLEVSPAFSLEEFPTLVATIGEEAKKYL